MVVVIGHATAGEGRLDEALELSRRHVARSRGEPGCLSHEVLRDPDQASRLVFVERWRSRAALAAHVALPESRAFGRALAGLCSAPPSMTIHDGEELSLQELLAS